MHLSATVLSYNQSSEAHSAKETKPHYSDPEADPHANPDESDAEMDRERPSVAHQAPGAYFEF